MFVKSQKSSTFCRARKLVKTGCFVAEHVLSGNAIAEVCASSFAEVVRTMPCSLTSTASLLVTSWYRSRTW
jgi:hypothetical protein